MPRPKTPRRWSPRGTRWLLSLYPPFLFQGIRVVELDPRFSYCRLRVARSWLTRNLYGTTFGGTIFSAADPIHAVLYWQRFARRGERVQTWLRSATIRYMRAANCAP